MQTGDFVYIFNREKNIHEKGTIVRRYTRQGIRRYDVDLERGSSMTGITTDSNCKFFINETLTNRINLGQ